jgi:glucan phosphoethanolaminetransferase (alkaline phosphatase superfamily)
MPGGIIWVYFVGTAFILAAIAFITHKQVKLAGYLLALLLFIFVIAIHFPNYLNSGDNDMKQIAFTNMLKDTALAAFALYLGSEASHLD